MKKSQILLIVIGFILIAFMATNPSIEEHRDAIKKELFSAIESDNNSNRNNAQILGEKIGESIGTAIIDRAVNKQNYLLFSFGTFQISNIDIDNKVTLGIFGQIFLLKKYDKESKRFYKETNRVIKADSIAVNVDANFEKNEIKSDNKVNVIGTPIRIGNLEIAQKYFPDAMNWVNAKNACESLGKGWRLPNKNELNILYQNKDKIGSAYGFWSSEGVGNDNAWWQNFNVGSQDISYYGKDSRLYVRAVRSF
jgi:hypothetical protein